MEVKINNSHLEDLIWMSYRYCIGRHTITAAGHADTIKTILMNNPNALSEERKEFMAKDIREHIKDSLRFKSNIQIKGTNTYDIYSDLLYEISKHKNANTLKYIIDTYTHTIETEPLKEEKSYYESSDYDYIDLIPWVKLSNFLDKKCWKKITLEYDGKTEEIIAFPYPRQINNTEYEKVWTTCEDFCTSKSSLNPKYIKEIKDI